MKVYYYDDFIFWNNGSGNYPYKEIINKMVWKDDINYKINFVKDDVINIITTNKNLSMIKIEDENGIRYFTINNIEKRANKNYLITLTLDIYFTFIYNYFINEKIESLIVRSHQQTNYSLQLKDKLLDNIPVSYKNMIEERLNNANFINLFLNDYVFETFNSFTYNEFYLICSNDDIFLEPNINTNVPIRYMEINKEDYKTIIVKFDSINGNKIYFEDNENVNFNNIYDLAITYCENFNEYDWRNFIYNYQLFFSKYFGNIVNLIDSIVDRNFNINNIKYEENYFNINNFKINSNNASFRLYILKKLNINGDFIKDLSFTPNYYINNEIAKVKAKIIIPNFIQTLLKYEFYKIRSTKVLICKNSAINFNIIFNYLNDYVIKYPYLLKYVKFFSNGIDFELNRFINNKGIETEENIKFSIGAAQCIIYPSFTYLLEFNTNIIDINYFIKLSWEVPLVIDEYLKYMLSVKSQNDNAIWYAKESAKLQNNSAFINAGSNMVNSAGDFLIGNSLLGDVGGGIRGLSGLISTPLAFWNNRANNKLNYLNVVNSINAKYADAKRSTENTIKSIEEENILTSFIYNTNANDNTRNNNSHYFIKIPTLKSYMQLEKMYKLYGEFYPRYDNIVNVINDGFELMNTFCFISVDGDFWKLNFKPQNVYENIYWNEICSFLENGVRLINHKSALEELK